MSATQSMTDVAIDRTLDNISSMPAVPVVPLPPTPAAQVQAQRPMPAPLDTTLPVLAGSPVEPILPPQVVHTPLSRKHIDTLQPPAQSQAVEPSQPLPIEPLSPPEYRIHDIDVNMLTHAVQAYERILVWRLTPAVFNFFIRAYEEGIKRLNSLDPRNPADMALKQAIRESVSRTQCADLYVFQKFLQGIQQWNTMQVSKEAGDIVRAIASSSGEAKLAETIKLLFIFRAMLLTSVRPNSELNSSLSFPLQTLEAYLHKVLSLTAETLFRFPSLLRRGANDQVGVVLERQHRIQEIIKSAISNAIDDMLPYNHIIDTYLAGVLQGANFGSSSNQARAAAAVAAAAVAPLVPAPMAEAAPMASAASMAEMGAMIVPTQQQQVETQHAAPAAFQQQLPQPTPRQQQLQVQVPATPQSAQMLPPPPPPPQSSRHRMGATQQTPREAPMPMPERELMDSGRVRAPPQEDDSITSRGFERSRDKKGRYTGSTEDTDGSSSSSSDDDDTSASDSESGSCATGSSDSEASDSRAGHSSHRRDKHRHQHGSSSHKPKKSHSHRSRSH